MCLWLLTACLGMLPANHSPQIIVVQGVPAPIITPTTAPTTAAPITAAPTTAAPPTAAPTTAAPTTAAPTTAAPPTAAPTTAAPTTAAPTTAAPVTAPPTAAPTAAPTPAPTAAPTTAAPMTTGGELSDLILCNNPDVVCIFNPDEIAAGSLLIDPRLGTTPASSAAYQVPPITGYSAYVPSHDTAVRFPRDKRSIGAESHTEDYVMRMFSSEIRHRVKRQACVCVPTGTCVRPATNYGAGMIDIRIVTPTGSPCPASQEYCCGGYCCGGTITPMPVACGTVQAVPNTAVAPAAGQANYGEFPWQALILTKQNDFIGGGVLIDSLNVITVTHRLVNYVVAGTAPNLKVRLGEWDAAATNEPIPFQEYTIKKVFTHPSYNPNTLQFDITVLRLASPVPFTPTAGSVTTINRACLPPSSTTVYNGQRCWVAGWGKNMFGVTGLYQQILKKVDVPIVAPATCQTQMQTARLGPTFVLDTTSFVCAGGEANKDSCTGDGGSGLVCQVNGQWVVVGLVAWGLGCANPNVPGAYVNVAGLLPWIQQQVAAAA